MTNVDYIHTRNSGRIVTMIVVVWAVALIVSLAPQFGWKDPDYLDRINLQKMCLVSQDVAYQIFATCSTFYVPLLVILVLYWKIFQTARYEILFYWCPILNQSPFFFFRKRIRRRQEQRSTTIIKCQKTKGIVGSESTGRTKGFLTKRRFLHMKRSNSKKSTAAEALVASLVMMEGQSTTTTVDVMEEPTEDCSNDKQQVFF